MNATFFRMLHIFDKDIALRDAVFRLNSGYSLFQTYVVDSSSFGRIPGSAFAYWVSDQVRRMFGDLPPFEGDGWEVRRGLQTSDDFRFVRTAWEVEPSLTLSGNCEAQPDVFRRLTLEGNRWVPFAKGGSYSPYFSDLHLVTNWTSDGREMKAWAGSIYAGSPWSRIITNVEYFFRPGITWPRRTDGFSPRILPRGCIFADKSPTAFDRGDNHDSIFAALALVNSLAFKNLLALSLGRVSLAQSYEHGLIQQMPMPELGADSERTLVALSRAAHDLKRDVDRDDEVTHPFSIPAFVRARDASTLPEALKLLSEEDAKRKQRLTEIQREIDNTCFALYGFTIEDRAQIEREESAGTGVSLRTNEEDEGNTNSKPDNTRQIAYAEIANLTMYVLGCTFGRWDIRIGRDSSLAPKLTDPFAPLPICPPGALVGSDGLPATSGHIVSEEWLRARPDAITLPPPGSVQRPTIADNEYPIRVAWDGILVDDPEHPADIVRRVREALAVLWPGGNGARAEAIEREACEILGVRELRDYFRKPAGFFEDHLKRYSKSRRQAPIYWPLSTASGSYTLWIYYHRLTSDTLYTALNRYVEPKIEEVQRRLADDERDLESASGREASRLRASVEQGQSFLRELRDFRDELMRVAALPYRPDLNDGVIITAAPLHRLFRLPRWARDTEATWEKLERGDYDWAHLAYTLWPERVREKCRTDKSLAIAHGLEELYIEPPATAKKARGRKAMQVAEEVELLGEDE